MIALVPFSSLKDTVKFEKQNLGLLWCRESPFNFWRQFPIFQSVVKIVPWKRNCSSSEGYLGRSKMNDTNPLLQRYKYIFTYVRNDTFSFSRSYSFTGTMSYLLAWIIPFCGKDIHKKMFPLTFLGRSMWSPPDHIDNILTTARISIPQPS